MVVTRRSRPNNSGDDESVASSYNIGQRDGEPQQPPHRPPPPPPPPPVQMPTTVSGISPRPAIGTAPGINQTSSTRGGVNVSGSSDRNSNALSSVRVGDNLNDARQSEQPIQYLQVRVSTPHYHASKTYRGHHHSQSDPRRSSGRKPQSTVRSNRPSMDKGEIVRVLIPPTGFASERQLSDCLNHACNSDNDRNNYTTQTYADDASWDSTEEYFDVRGRSANVAGMFRESDGVFVPLSIIHSQPREFVNDVLSIARPNRSGESRQQHDPVGKSSIFITFLEIFGIIAVTMASWMTYTASQSVDWNKTTNKLESVFLAMMNLPFSLFDAVVEFPLKELYRHGPSFFGWEGESLARICSRVTHYGDEDFWRRNMEECEQIYASKEAAAMQIRKPILIGVIILILFYMIRSIIEARRHPQLDPNMVETYRAITMLARQLKRVVNNNR